MSDAAAKLRDEILAMTTLAGGLRRLLEEGRILELGPLEGRVEACCARLRGLPRADAAALRPALLALLDDLGRLAAALRQSQTETAERLRQTAQRRRALTAYGGRGGER